MPKNGTRDGDQYRSGAMEVSHAMSVAVNTGHCFCAWGFHAVSFLEWNFNQARNLSVLNYNIKCIG